VGGKEREIEREREREILKEGKRGNRNLLWRMMSGNAISSPT